MPYDANKGYYVADSRGYEDTREEPWEEPEPEPEEEPTEEDDPIVWTSLQAQLEAAEAVAGQIQALETRIEILTGALEAIKKACMTWPGKGPAMRHIETLANLGLNDPRHEHIRRGK
jgi:hypothetical protein